MKLRSAVAATMAACMIVFPISALAVSNQQIIPVANYSRDMIGNIYTSGGSTDVGGTSAIMFKIGFATNKIRVLYANYLNAGAGETTSGLSTVTVQSSIQAYIPTTSSPAPIRLTFGGANSIALTPGQQVYTDWYTPPSTLSVGQFVSIRTYSTVPSGGSFPTGPYVATGSSGVTGFTGTTGADNYVQNNFGIPSYANGSNQLLTAGSAYNWASTTGSYNYAPLAIDGYAADGVSRPIVALAGDSIMAGSLDLSDSCGGAAVRAMISLGIPYYSLARGNEQVSNVFSGSLFSQRYQREKISTIAIDEYGTNDLNANTSFTAALLESYQLKFWQILANNGQPVIPVTLLPRVTTSGGASPISNQTQNTNVAAYEAYNAWLRAPASSASGITGISATYDAAQVGVTIPTIIDPASYVETDAANDTPGGPSAPNTGGYVWTGAGNNVNYTADGTHPSTLGALLEMPAFTASSVVAAINATTPPAYPTSTIQFVGH